MDEYKIGDRDERVWGSYEVLDVGMENGEEFCKKTITVNPGQMLSLQAHDFRREEWTVENGELTVICNGELKTLTAGESANIPLNAIHCMSNTSDTPVTVIEIQRGKCREEDNHRLADFAGREVETPEDPDDPIFQASLDLYRTVEAQIKGKAASAA